MMLSVDCLYCCRFIFDVPETTTIQTKSSSIAVAGIIGGSLAAAGLIIMLIPVFVIIFGIKKVSICMRN